MCTCSQACESHYQLCNRFHFQLRYVCTHTRYKFSKNDTLSELFTEREEIVSDDSCRSTLGRPAEDRGHFTKSPTWVHCWRAVDVQDLANKGLWKFYGYIHTQLYISVLVCIHVLKMCVEALQISKTWLTKVWVNMDSRTSCTQICWMCDRSLRISKILPFS